MQPAAEPAADASAPTPEVTEVAAPAEETAETPAAEEAGATRTVDEVSGGTEEPGAKKVKVRQAITYAILVYISIPNVDGCLSSIPVVCHWLGLLLLVLHFFFFRRASASEVAHACTRFCCAAIRLLQCFFFQRKLLYTAVGLKGGWLEDL